jgi:hypothetical protein
MGRSEEENPQLLFFMLGKVLVTPSSHWSAVFEASMRPDNSLNESIFDLVVKLRVGQIGLQLLCQLNFCINT